MRVTVLCGGPSNEREVSLVSGEAVATGLREAGHEVTTADIDPGDLSALDRQCDVVFPALHGAFGEDGTLQAILEERKIPFVGSGSAASRVAIDKVQTKRVWQRAGIPTPAFYVASAADRTPGPVEAPCVVKSIRSGSSVGVYVCPGRDAALARIAEVVAADGEALVEQFVRGTELTVGVLEGRVLPPIRVAYAAGFFDYAAKYGASGGAEHRFDTGLPGPLVEQVGRSVLAAHDALGCRDLSRTDVMVDAAAAFYLLEINTLPGFTPRSLLPEMAAREGIAFPQLVDRLVRAAATRGG